MTTEQELKDQCTPDIIKRMVELAEGFEWKEGNYSCNYIIDYSGVETLFDEDIFNRGYYPLLIHRAVEGWNKKQENKRLTINKYQICLNIWPFLVTEKAWNYRMYQPQSLTRTECAMLHCMIDIFKEERG